MHAPGQGNGEAQGMAAGQGWSGSGEGGEAFGTLGRHGGIGMMRCLGSGGVGAGVAASGGDGAGVGAAATGDDVPWGTES